MRPSCPSLRRKSLARWRRWTDGRAWPLCRVGPASGRGRGRTQSVRGSCCVVCFTQLLGEGQVLPAPQPASSWVHLCADGRGSLCVVPQASTLQLTRRVPCPLLSDT